MPIVPLDRDDPSIEEVLATVGDEHRLLDYWIGEADVVQGAVIAGHVVGIGARFQSALHPTRDWLTIHVKPAHRRQGIGSRLHETLAGARRRKRGDLFSSKRSGVASSMHHAPVAERTEATNF